MVGTQAKQQASRGNPKNTIQDFIHLVGIKSLDSEPVKSYLQSHQQQIEIDEKTGLLAFRLADDRLVTVTELLKILLEHLRENAEAFLGGGGQGLDGAVLTVPMSFTLDQMKIVEEAAKAAKLTVLQIVSESAATMLAYQQIQLQQPSGAAWKNNKSESSAILVVDFGGHSLDFSLMQLSKQDGLVRTLAYRGHDGLGGHRLDRLIAESILAVEFERKTRFPSSEVCKSRKPMHKLLLAAEKAKIMLSQGSSTSAPCFVESLHEGIDFQYSLTRMRFDSAIQPVLAECRQALQSFLLDEKKSYTIAHVIFVGGSSKIPAFQALVRNAVVPVGSQEEAEFHLELDPEEAACLGAGLQSFLLDSFSLTLGLDDHKPGHLVSSSK